MPDSTLDQLLAQLRSASEHERAAAASQLQVLGYPQAMEACLKTINDDADILHQDMTPSVHALVRIGIPVLKPIAELLASEDELTRLRALRVLEGVSMQAIGNEDSWRKWWHKIGYDVEKKPAENRAALTRLNTWIAQQQASE